MTITTCTISVMMLNNMTVSTTQMLGFIAMLGVTMVAPGGAIMAALGILQSILDLAKQ